MNKTAPPIEWQVSQGLVDYPTAIGTMERRVADIASGQAPQLAWLLEHPPLYTAGSSAKTSGLRDGGRFPVYETGRGGEWTYHGPGQRIAYLMLDLKSDPDLRRYVRRLEQWLIATLARLDVEAFAREGRVGIWVMDKNGQEAKIAAIGIRVRQWVTYHGISLNVNPDLSHYQGIIPCGISEYGVTSLEKLGVKATMEEVDVLLRREFEAAL